MAIGGVAGAWSPNAPSDSSNVGLGAGDIRSLKSNVQEPLDSEHYFSTGAESVKGAHRAGSARVHYGTASQVSSADTDGRLMWTSDTSRLYVVNSGTTVPIAGRFALFTSKNSINGAPETTTGPTHFHAIESGAVTINKGTTTQTIALQHTWIRGIVVLSHCYHGGDGTVAGGWPSSDKSILVSASSFAISNVVSSTGNFGASTGTYVVTFLVHGARVHNGTI